MTNGTLRHTSTAAARTTTRRTSNAAPAPGSAASMRARPASRSPERRSNSNAITNNGSRNTSTKA